MLELVFLHLNWLCSSTKKNAIFNFISGIGSPPPPDLIQPGHMPLIHHGLPYLCTTRFGTSLQVLRCTKFDIELFLYNSSKSNARK